MRIAVDYVTSYSYRRPARSIIQVLRLAPRSHEGQQCGAWRIETDVDARLRVGEDAFGNIVHTLQTQGPVANLGVRVRGEASTSDTHGVVRGAVERFPPPIFLRETPLTQPDPALGDLAAAAAAETADPLDRLHHLLRTVHAEMAFTVGATGAETTAAQAWTLRRGVCQDLAHVFIACARQMGSPARYVSGQLLRADGQELQDAAHAWAEAHVEGLGWVGFDPANGVSPTEAYVRVAIGLDYLGAAPVRGAAYGGEGEAMAVRLSVRQSRFQSQS